VFKFTPKISTKDTQIHKTRVEEVSLKVHPFLSHQRVQKETLIKPSIEASWDSGTDDAQRR